MVEKKLTIGKSEPRKDAWDKVIRGITTINEVIAVTQ